RPLAGSSPGGRVAAEPGRSGTARHHPPELFCSRDAAMASASGHRRPFLRPLMVARGKRVRGAGRMGPVPAGSPGRTPFGRYGGSPFSLDVNRLAIVVRPSPLRDDDL